MVSSVNSNTYRFQQGAYESTSCFSFANFNQWETTSDFWYGFKDFFCEPTELGKKMRGYAAELDLSNFEKKLAFRETLVTAFQSEEFPQINYFIYKAMRKMVNTPDTNLLLDQLMSDLFKVYARDPQPLIDKFKGLFTLEKMEQVVKSQWAHFSVPDLEKEQYTTPTAKLIHEQAGVYRPILKEIDDESYNTLLGSISTYFVNTFDFFVNLFLNLFQLNNFFEEDNLLGLNADLVAEAKYRALRDSLGYIGSILAALSIYTGDVLLTIASATAIALVAVITAYIYFKYIKPCPEQLRPFKNLVTQARKGQIEEVYGRDKEIDQLEETLCSNHSGIHVHPLLCGATGVGKTEIVRGLALRIAKGTCRHELKGKKLFAVNTTQLNSGNFLGEMYNLERVKRKIAGYESDAIFFFDEVHEAFKDNAKLGNNLKTEIMDPGTNSFPYCIFATTETEYEQYIHYDPVAKTGDQAFERRVSLIHVLPNSSENTQAILSNMMAKTASHLIIDNTAIKLLGELTTFDGTTALSQPCISKGLLNKAISIVAHPALNQDGEIQQLKNQRDVLATEEANDFGSHFTSEAMARRKALNELNTQIAQKIVEKQGIINELDKFHQLVRERSELKNELNKTSVLLDNAMETQSCADDQAMAFLLQYHYQQKALTEVIASEESRLNAKYPDLVLRIDDTLITKLIDEAKTNKSPVKNE